MKFQFLPTRFTGLYLVSLPLLAANLFLAPELLAQVQKPEKAEHPPVGKTDYSVANISNGPGADPVAENSADSPPSLKIFTGEEATTQRMFGARGGYIHPFVTLQEEWTDNLYNLNFNEKENFLTTASAGLWLSLPRTDKPALNFDTRNSAIGGLRYSLPTGNAFERFQFYLGGIVDYRSYSADSDLNYLAWRLEGMYQQNLPAGISFTFIDQFSRSRDKIDIASFDRTDFLVDGNDVIVTASPSQTRTYSSNLASFGINSEMSHRFSAQLNYSNFFLDYEGTENTRLDRVDNRVSFSLTYHHSPKTNIFAEYDHTFITYDSDTFKDSDDDRAYLGVDWKGSEKSSLMAKGGYQQKQYSPSARDKTGTFTAEIQFHYQITDKTNTSFFFYKALEETDSLNNQGKDSIAARILYEQQFTYKIRGTLNFWYEKNSYDDFTRLDIHDRISGREDKRFTVRPALQYVFRDWLLGEIAYRFENCNSSDNLYDYTSQSLLLSLNIAF